MKPAPFDYAVPDSLDEAVSLLEQFGDSAKVIAGGQSLVPAMNLRLTQVDHLVDLGRIDELRGVERLDGTVRVGAMIPHCELERGAAAPVPLLAAVAPYIGHFQIRSRGTLGGSLAHADPAAELPAVAVCLDATVELAGTKGRRTVPAADFFRGIWSTAAEPDEVLTSVTFGEWAGDARFSIEEVARRHGDFAIAGSIGAVELDDDRVVTKAAIALFGVGGTPVRCSVAEEALVGLGADDVDLAEIARLAVADLDPPSDIHAPAELRRTLAAETTRRVLVKVLAGATEDGGRK
jgi:carbon-monoxide dehydrogenase medium subunit